MDTLHLNTDKKYFNTLMSFREIALAYKTGRFPVSYCMMCTSLGSNVYLCTENNKVIETESEKAVAVDGY